MIFLAILYEREHLEERCTYLFAFASSDCVSFGRLTFFPRGVFEAINRKVGGKKKMEKEKLVVSPGKDTAEEVTRFVRTSQTFCLGEFLTSSYLVGTNQTIYYLF